MSLGEVYSAVCAAEKAVGVNPNWWIGHQTLGRAQLGLGEVKLVSVTLVMLERVHFSVVINLWKLTCTLTNLSAFQYTI